MDCISSWTRRAAKRWVLRTVVHGRRRDIGLGGLRLVPLAVARDKAAELRRVARQGGNPLEVRRKARAIVPTFTDAARRALQEHRSAWRNAKHASQWINTLTTYAFPILGERRGDEIETADVLKVLSPIWLSKPETARRVLQRIATVLSWAKAAGFREGENPTEGVEQGLPRQPNRKNHFEAMPYADVPGFVRRPRKSVGNERVGLAFELLVLTATRTNVVLQAQWHEVDWKKKVWTISADRMKVGQDHRVPLTPRVLKLLKRANAIGEGGLIFPGRSEIVPMSNMVFLMTLRRMGVDFTVHGFRSSFRDWAAERTYFPREVCEMALAHSIKDKTEAAYRRGDLFEKRRALMKCWGDYCYTGKAPRSWR